MKEVVKSVSKFWWIMLVLFILGIGSCSIGVKQDIKQNERVSYDATLINAYSSMQRCGKHNSCEEFMGRFKLKDGRYINREIDGFFYHNYVDKGRVDMPAYVTLSKRELEGRDERWFILNVFGVVMFFAMIIGLFTKFLDDI